jgi:iron complex outermembrane receptor protein
MSISRSVPCTPRQALKIIGISSAVWLGGLQIGAADTPTNGSSPKSNASDSPELQEIVVTATKFKEPLQSVPLAVTAITSEKLDKLGVVDVKQLDALAPNLDIGTASTDSNAVRVTLRGVGQGTLDGASDPGVALHVDGVYLGRASALTQDLMDVDRVEVLRGPQGTLYGRNAPGGAINIITIQPGPTESYTTDVTVGNYNEERVRASANIPLTDNLFSRVAVFSDTHDGYMQNSYPDSRNPDDKDAHGGRAQLLFTDDGGNSYLLRVYGERMAGVGPGVRRLGTDTGNASGWPSYVQVGLQPGTGATVYGDPYLYPRTGAAAAPVSSNLLQVDENANQSLDQLLKGSDFTMVFKIGDWSTLKSLTAWESDNSNIVLDSDGSSVAIETIQRAEFARQFSQEFDWSSAGDGPWKWILGGFFWHEQINEALVVQQAPGVLALSAPLYTQPGPPGSPFVPYTPTGGFAAGGDGYYMNQTGTDDSLSSALFGQTTFPIIGPLSLTAGYRYTWDSLTQNNTGGGFYDVTDGWYQNGTQAPSPPVHTSVSYGNWGSHVSLDLAVTKDNLLYMSWGRGYKAGGIDFNGASVNGARIPYLPEFLNAYEVGSKNEFLDHRLRLNLAAFYYDYDDLQTFELTTVGPRTENAANATVRGAELEWAWLALKSLEFDGSYGYLDARYNNFTLTTPVPANYDGNYLNYAPKGTLRFGVEYTTPAWSGSSLSWRADYLYKSAYYMDEANTVYDLQKGYPMVNARARWTRENGKLYVEFWGKNLNNAQYVTSEEIGPPFACGCRNINVGDPRTYGLGVGFKF